MVRRFLVWLGAGMVTAGVAAGMVGRGRRRERRQSAGRRHQGDYLRRSRRIRLKTKPDSDNDSTGTPKPKPSGKKPKKDATADPKDADDSDAAQQDDEDKTADETEPPAQQPGRRARPPRPSKTRRRPDSDTAETAADKPATPPAIKRQAHREAGGQARSPRSPHAH